MNSYSSSSQDKGKDDVIEGDSGHSKDPEAGEKDFGNGLGCERIFDHFCKIDGTKDGKIKSGTTAYDNLKLYTRLAFSEITEKGWKKHLDKAGGLDRNAFKQGIENLLEEKAQELIDDLMSLSGQDKGKDDVIEGDAGHSKDPEAGEKVLIGNGLGRIFDHFSKIDGTKDGKIKSGTTAYDNLKLYTRLAFSGITEERWKKHFDKEGGLDLNAFKQGIENLREEKAQKLLDYLMGLSGQDNDKDE